MPGTGTGRARPPNRHGWGRCSKCSVPDALTDLVKKRVEILTPLYSTTSYAAWCDSPRKVEDGVIFVDTDNPQLESTVKLITYSDWTNVLYRKNYTSRNCSGSSLTEMRYLLSVMMKPTLRTADESGLS